MSLAALMLEPSVPIIVPPYIQGMETDLTGIRRFLEAVPLIDVSAAFRYVAESPQQDWPKDSFPNLAPPFPSFWMECETPRWLNKGDHVEDLGGTGRMGMACYSTDLEGKDAAFRAAVVDVALPTNVSDSATAVRKSVVSDETRWLFVGELWGSHKRPDGLEVVIPFAFREILAVDREGKCVASTTQIKFTRREHAPDPGELSTSNHGFFFAVALMHCKNVTIQGPARRSAYTRAQVRKAQVRVHTLHVEPMKKVLHSEGRSAEVGLQQAMHICRGHFKTYKDKGLFGRLKGTFWWDSTVRGSPTAGTVEKDYNVKAPGQ